MEKKRTTIQTYEVKSALEKFYSEYKLRCEVEYNGEKAKIDKYSQIEMARKFAEVLNNLMSV